MNSPTRRQVVSSVVAGLSILGTGTVPQRARRFVEQYNDSDVFPLPTIVAPRDREWWIDRDTGGNEVTARVSGGEGPLVQRSWNPRSTETDDLRTFEPATDEISLTTDDEDTIDSIYRLPDDGDAEFLFDLGVPESIRETVRDRATSATNGHFDRTFTDRGIELTWNADTDLTPTFEIPYSLYVHAYETNTSGPTPSPPFPTDNRFDRYSHEDLVTRIDAVATERANRTDEDLAAYWRVAALAEFVQSVPHATDWQSQREMHHIRSPAEMLGELTADCKDAALLLYDLLESYDLDPVLILLVGDVADTAGAVVDSVAGDSNDEATTSEEEKEKGEMKLQSEEVSIYPNHVAVGLPMEQIAPLPDEIAEQASTISHDGRDYLYLESTYLAVPGVYQQARERARVILYNNRRDFVSDFLPVV